MDVREPLRMGDDGWMDSVTFCFPQTASLPGKAYLSVPVPVPLVPVPVCASVFLPPNANPRLAFDALWFVLLLQVSCFQPSIQSKQGEVHVPFLASTHLWVLYLPT